MQAICGFTKIHGKGNEGIEVLVNNIRDAEIARQREREHQEIERIREACEREIKIIKGRLDRADKRHNADLAQKLTAIRARVYPKRNKAKDTFDFCLACIFNFLMWAHLLVYDPIEKEREKK